MPYIEVNISITPFSEENCDIVTAYLADLPFESFSAENDCLKAYIRKESFDNESIKDCLDQVKEMAINCSYTFTEIADVNWNSEWEKNFDPILVDNICMVRAPFHSPVEGLKYDIVIEPKMSFGTGHHGTTYQMIDEALRTDFANKVVIDMGCGTGVLAILAVKMGAKSAIAIDIDQWAYDNTIENCLRNNVTQIKVLLGDVSQANGSTCDLMFANINRNVLLADMVTYKNNVIKGGVLLLSGFYTEDLDMIRQSAETNGFVFKKHTVMNNWVMAKFVRG